MVHKEIAAHETHEGAPMKQNLRGQAFVVFCVFSGQTPITEDRGGKSPPKKIFAKRDEFSL
jgi:hypothetical protein